MEAQISTNTLSLRRIMTRIKKLHPGKMSFRWKKSQKPGRKDEANLISPIPKRESPKKRMIASMET